jgi:hypothetical protein
MARWRRPGARELLLVFLLLTASILILDWLSPAAIAHYNRSVGSLLSAAFFIWLVSRGSRVARMVLIVASGLTYAVVVLAVARLWDLTIVVLVTICAVQVALLASPAVYARTRRLPYQARMSWTQLFRRPPPWLLPWGLVLGALVTLAYLGSMDWVTVPGCRPAADACQAIAEGYPLRWLTSHHNVPVIDKYALVRDFTQWALASSSVLYVAWLRLRPYSPVPELAGPS